MKQASHLGKLIDNQKVSRDIELEQKKGLSVYHQNTFTDMFESEAHNPHFSEPNQLQQQFKDMSEAGRGVATSIFDAKESFMHNEESSASRKAPALLSKATVTPATAQGARARPCEAELSQAARLTLRSQENPNNLQITAPRRTDLPRASQPMSLMDSDVKHESYLTATKASQ